MTNELSSQIAIAAASSLIIQWAKNWAKIPWINQNTAAINRVVSIVVSGIGALGLHFSYDSTAGALTLTGLSLHSILQGLWTWIEQYAIQHGWYKAVFSNGAPPAQPQP